jgi:hypothetical protein
MRFLCKNKRYLLVSTVSLGFPMMSHSKAMEVRGMVGDQFKSVNQCCGSAFFYADPDPVPAFHFNADPDPDPAFHFNADMYPDQDSDPAPLCCDGNLQLLVRTSRALF